MNDDNEKDVLAENPALIHWEYNVDAVLESGDVTKGYWTNVLMEEAVHEFLDLFYFLYGGINDKGELVSECYNQEGDKLHHVPVINMDWSSNHDAKGDDVLAAKNFRRSWGTRYFEKSGLAKAPPRGDNDDGSCTLEAGDLGLSPPLVGKTRRLKGQQKRQLKVGGRQYFVFQKGDVRPQFWKEGDDEDWVGQDKGLDQILWERGYDVTNMTMKGNKVKKKKKKKTSKKKEKAAARAEHVAHAFVKGDLVILLFQEDAEQGEETVVVEVPYLYRVTKVPKGHVDVSSTTDLISVELMRKQPYTTPRGETSSEYYCPDTKDRMIKTSDMLSSVDEEHYIVVAGRTDHLRRNKGKKHICVVDFDLQKFWKECLLLR